MRHLRLLGLTLLLTTPLAPSTAEEDGGDGDHDRRGDPDHGAAAEAPREDRGHPHHHAAWSEDDANFALVLLAVSPVWAPMVFCDDDWSSTAIFPAYPYPDEHGYLSTIDDSPTWGRWNRYAGRAGVDVLPGRDGTMVESDSLMELPDRLSLGLEAWTISPARDRRDLYPHSAIDPQLFFRYAQSSVAEFRVGVGALTVADDRSSTGASYTWAMDLFPVRPWVVSSSATWSHAGSHYWTELRATAGITWHGAELYEGFEHLRFDHTHQNGPLLGVRWWF